jgi:hypothetical protein
MGHRLFVLGLLILAPLALAQTTSDEAIAKMREREAARISAASMPSTITQAQADALNQQIRALKAQLAEAQAQIAMLKGQAVKVAVPAVPPQGIPSTFTTRAKQRIKTPATKQDKQDMDEAVRVDAFIAAFIKANPDTTTDYQESMYAGRPRIGMTEDQLSVFGALMPRSESVDGKRFAFIANSDHWYRIVTDSEKRVVAIEDIGRAQPHLAP